MKTIEEGMASGSLSGRVFKKLETAILEEYYKPGDPLVESKLSAELGVSRTPVREALCQLEQEGLVNTVPNKGTFVVGISREDIVDIYTIRITVEGLASKWAAEKITDEEIFRLHEIVELQEFYSTKGDIVQVWHLDKRFHEMLYNACRSRPLRIMLTSFHNYIQKARETSFMAVGRIRASVREHREIFEAVQNRDSEMAKKLTEIHIQNALNNVLENLK